MGMGQSIELIKERALQIEPDAGVVGLAMLLWSVDPDDPARLATPFAHATAAAAMDLKVELYFAARSVLLLKPGVAADLRASTRHDKTIAEWMDESATFGVEFLACSDALAAQGLGFDAILPLCKRHGGAVQFVARAIDPAWTTLVF
jgi:hypothetical protein